MWNIWLKTSYSQFLSLIKLAEIGWWGQLYLDLLGLQQDKKQQDCLYFASGISVFIAPIRATDIKTYFQIGVSLLNDFDDGSDELGFINFEFRF